MNSLFYDYHPKGFVMIRYFPFGKYKDQRISKVITNDLNYVLWFVENYQPILSVQVFNYLIIRMRMFNPEPQVKLRRLKFLGRRLK